MVRKSAPKARNQAKREPTNEEEFHFSSQGSSDDNILQAIAVAQEKKRKESEKKFLVAGAKHIKKEPTEASERVEAIRDAASEECQRFLDAHASIDDDIRRLWTLLQTEYATLAMLAEKRGKINTASGQSCDAAQIKALTQVKDACLEHQRIVNVINPTFQDDA